MKSNIPIECLEQETIVFMDGLTEEQQAEHLQFLELMMIHCQYIELSTAVH